MLKQDIQDIINADPEYAAITPVIEKEILHHDIIDVMVKQDAGHAIPNIHRRDICVAYFKKVSA